MKKFYVLYRTSERNAARLDWYESEEAFETNPSIRKTLFIEEIVRIERVSANDAVMRQKYGDIGKSVYTWRFLWLMMSPC